MDLLETYPRRLGLFIGLAVALLFALRGGIAYLNEWRAEQEIMVGRYAWALSEYERQTVVMPGDAYAHLNRGYMLYRLRRDAEAGEAFRRASDIDGSLPEASYWLALALQRQGDRRGAIEVLETSTVHNESFENWQLLATLYQREGDIPAAVRTLRRAAGIFPDQKESFIDLAEQLEAKQ